MNDRIPPKFNFRDISKWRVIDLSTTIAIAHKCSTGVDFRGCSKSHVIESMAKPPAGYTTDADKFVFMMDRMAKKLPGLNTVHKIGIKQAIQACLSAYLSEDPEDEK